MNIEEIYLKRRKEYEDNAGKLERRSGMYSTLRLSTFAAGVFLTVLAFIYLRNVHGFISMGIFLILFLSLVVKHQKIIDEASRYRILAEINRRCIARMKGSWTEFADKGAEYANPGICIPMTLMCLDMVLFFNGSIRQIRFLAEKH